MMKFFCLIIREHKEWLTEELRRRIDEEENLAKTKREIQRIQDEVSNRLYNL